jgi:ABC-type glutathione transport system ATPase component
MHLLEVTGLTLRASSGATSLRRGEEREILRGADLTVSRGKTVALIGRSGEGKSSIARCIAGLTRPVNGSIVFDGVEIFPEEKNRRLIGHAIQLVFQAGTMSLNPRLTIRDTLAEALRVAGPASGKADITSRAAALLESVRLSPEFLQRRPQELSGGQRQRVAIARALAVAPRLLILDEPTSALDPLTQAHVLELLSSLQITMHYAMLFITHDLPVAVRFCDELAILANGRIVEQGATGGVRAHPRHPATVELLRMCRI